MINYKWTFSAFDCKVDEELEKVVTTVHWRCNILRFYNEKTLLF